MDALGSIAIKAMNINGQAGHRYYRSQFQMANKINTAAMTIMTMNTSARIPTIYPTLPLQDRS